MSARSIVLLLAAAAAAGAQIAAPRLGCLVDGEGRLRPVVGAAGVFLLGEPEEGEVMAAACGDGLAVVKKKDSIELRGPGFRVERPAPEGGALVALAERGETALVYFAATREWFRLDRTSMREARPLAAAPLAISDPARPKAIVRRGDTLWMDRPGGEPLPRGAEEPVLLVPGGALFCRGEELALAEWKGAERTWTLPARAEALERLGRDWVEVRLSGGAGRLALSLETGELYRLPEAER